MSDTTRIRLHASLVTGLIIFGLGGFMSAITALTTLRADVQGLSRQVSRLDSDRDTVVRHTVEIGQLRQELERLERRN